MRQQSAFQLPVPNFVVGRCRGEERTQSVRPFASSSYGAKQMQNAQKVPLSPLSSPLLSVCLDLYIVSDAADEVPSGEHPMGDDPPEAASSSPGELSRALLAIVTRDLLFFLVVSLSH